MNSPESTPLASIHFFPESLRDKDNPHDLIAVSIGRRPVVENLQWDEKEESEESKIADSHIVFLIWKYENSEWSVLYKKTLPKEPTPTEVGEQIEEAIEKLQFIQRIRSNFRMMLSLSDIKDHVMGISSKAEMMKKLEEKQTQMPIFVDEASEERIGEEFLIANDRFSEYSKN